MRTLWIGCVFGLLLVGLAWSLPAPAADAWFASTDNNPKPVLYRDPTTACFRGVMFAYIDADRPSAKPASQYRILSSAVQDEGDGDFHCQGVIYRRDGPGATQWSLVLFDGEALIIGMPDSSNPKCNDSCCEPGGCTSNGSNPIQTSTGNKHQVETDFTGTGAFPLRFTRVYNSNRSIEQAIAPMGAGWSHSYGGFIVGVGAEPFTQAVVYRPDGRILNFQVVGGVWQGDTDISERLNYTENGDNAGMPQWTLTTNDDEVEIYDGMGLLQSITNRGGLKQTLNYLNSSGRNTSIVQSVSDPVGRTLNFGYNGSQQVASLTDGNGAVIQYGYTTDGNNNLQTVTYPDFTGTKIRTFYYNESNQTGGVSQPYALTGIVDENSQRYASWGYDSTGRAVLSVHGPYVGGTIDHTGFQFNSNGTVTVTDGLNQARTFTFQTLFNVARYTILDTACDYCGTNFTSRGYDTNGYPSTGTDFRGFQTTSQYQATDSSGHARGLETQLDEALGQPEERITNTTWDANYRVPDTRTVTNHAGSIETRTDWVYNTRGQPTARCEYDLTQSGASSYVCATTGTPPAGIRRWVYTYCDVLNSATPDPIGSGNENLGKGCPLVGLIRRVDGPRTDVNDWTTYQYYLTSDTGTPPKFLAGDLNETIDALSHVTQYIAYDGNGRITQMLDANGIASSLSYHPRGWLHIRTVCANTNCSASPNDATTQTDYDGVGNIVKITQPDGVYLSYTFDNAHRLTNITDNLGDHIDYTLDVLGHRTAEKTFDVSDAVNPRRLLTSVYNTLARLTDEYDAQVRDTKFSYDGNGNRTDRTDPLGVKSHWDFDGLNRLKDQIGDFQGTDPSTANSKTSYSLDTRDNITSVTDPDGQPPGTIPATIYTFDGLNDLKQLQSPDTGTTAYGTITQPGYDAAGNRLMQTDNRGTTWTMAYDALNRLTGTTYPTASLNVAYSYDSYATNSCVATSYPVGRLTGMTDSSGSTQYCYDLRGNITEKIQVTKGFRFDTRYTYNLADRLMSITYPSGAVVNYTRDTDGRIQTVSVTPPGGSATSIITNLSWQPFGPPITYTFAQGSQTLTKTFDQNYWMTDVTGSALNLHFCRDAESNITSLVPSASACTGTPTEKYVYDNLYRLTHVQDGTSADLQDFTYNLTGDRLTKTLDPAPTQTYTYTPSTHRLDGIGTNARMLDPNGNTTETTGIATLDFTFDNRNRMTAVSRNSTPITSYDYNAKGERVYKSTSYPANDTRWFVYGETYGLLGEYTAATVQEYVWADGTPVAILATTGETLTPGDRIFANGFEVPPVITSTVQYIHTDQLDSPRAVTNTAGTSEWSWPWQTNPFGETAPSGALTLNLRFPGQYADAETALSYNIKRDYEPYAGRYIESDPIGIAVGPSTYLYASGNTIKKMDLFGLSDESCCRSAAATKFFQTGKDGNGAWGTVMCCGGKSVACTALALDASNTTAKIFKKCAEKHEERHIPDMLPCKCGVGPYVNGTTNPGPSECAASRVEVQCLGSSSDDCGADVTCQRTVFTRIVQLVGFGNGNKPGCFF